MSSLRLLGEGSVWSLCRGGLLLVAAWEVTLVEILVGIDYLNTKPCSSPSFCDGNWASVFHGCQACMVIHFDVCALGLNKMNKMHAQPEHGPVGSV